MIMIGLIISELLIIVTSIILMRRVLRPMYVIYLRYCINGMNIVMFISLFMCGYHSLFGIGVMCLTSPINFFFTYEWK